MRKRTILWLVLLLVIFMPSFRIGMIEPTRYSRQIQSTTLFLADNGTTTYIPIENSTTADTTLPASNLDWGPLALAVAMGAAVLLLIWFILRRKGAALTEIKAISFNFVRMCKELKVTRLGKYNQQAGIMVFLILMVVFVPPVAAQGVKDLALNLALTSLGWFSGSVFTFAFFMYGQNKETDKNAGKLFAGNDCYDQNGVLHRMLWRRVAKGTKVNVEKGDLDKYLEKTLDIAISRGLVEGNNTTKKAIRAQFEKMGKVQAYRSTVEEDWNVLLIMAGEWDDVMSAREAKVFVDTKQVNVQYTSLSTVFVGDLDKTVDDVEAKTQVKRDIACGVFVVIVSPRSVLETIIAGKYTAPSMIETQLGQIKHIAQQGAVTGEAYTRKSQQLDKATREKRLKEHKQKVGDVSAFLVFVRSWKRLFGIEDKKTTAFNLLGYFALFGLIWYAVFSLIGWI